MPAGPISIHALLAESDPRSGGPWQAEHRISIHALLAESDWEYWVGGYGTANHFYPRSPCGERPGGYAVDNIPVAISIHALLAESDCNRLHPSQASSHFYPRSPCGERLLTEINKMATGQISIHALLAESDSRSRSGRTSTSAFLSTLSLRRATRRAPPRFLMTRFLSTLSLRRATGIPNQVGTWEVISIHALLAESDPRHRISTKTQ